jgi:hypothetical protein
MTQPLIPELPEPDRLQVRIGVTPRDAAGKSYPLLGLESNGVSVQFRITAGQAEELAANLGPALAAVAAESRQRETDLVRPAPGLIIPTNGNGGPGGS